MSSGINCVDLKHLNPLEDMPDDHFLAIIYGVRRSGKTTMLKQFIYDMYPRMANYQVHVFCSTAQFNTTSYDWIPKKAIVSDTSEIEKKMEDILSNQREKLEKLAKSGKLKPAGVSGQGGAKKKGKPKAGKTDNKAAQGKRANPNHAHEKEKRQKLTDAHNYALKAGEEDEEGEDDVPDLLIIMDDVCSEDSIRSAKSMGTVAMNGRQYRISCVILSQMVAGSGSVPPRVRTQVLCRCDSDGSTV